MPEETKITPIDTTTESISKLQKSYDDLYRKYIQLLDEFEEMMMGGGTEIGKEVVAFNAEVYCETDDPAYIYFRIDEEMVKINNIYVDVYPTDYRSPVTI